MVEGQSEGHTEDVVVGSGDGVLEHKDLPIISR